MTRLPIDSIEVGDRHRHDLGDIKALAESMTEVGLLHPVVVTADHRLIAGQRRISAARSLGWADIEVTVAENISQAATLLRAESDENACRKDFTPTEAEAIASAREALLKPLAEKAKARPGQERTAKFAGRTGEDARPREVAATGTGYSHETIRKVREVKDKAESEDTPEPVREVAVKALTEMDQTGRVDGSYRAVKEAEQRQAEQAITDAIDQRIPNAAADRERGKQRARWSRLISAAAEINTMSPQAVAAVLTDPELAAAQITSRELAKFISRVEAHRRPELRIVGDVR